MTLHQLLQNKYVVLIAWQVACLILTSGGTICSVLALYYGSTITLLMLAMSYFNIFIVNCFWWPRSSTPWWKYIVIAVAGFAGDWTGVLAYNYTSLATAIVLCTTVVIWVAPLAYFVVGRKVNWKQGLAILIGIAGVSMILVAEGFKDSKWKGCVLALSSAIFYAISCVSQEIIVIEDSLRLFFCRFSSVATPAAIILSGSIEWKIIRDFPWSAGSFFLMYGYSILLASYYMYAPFLLQYSNATVMNLSSLASNFYSLLINILFFGAEPSILYLIGFLFIPVGLAIYTIYTPKDVGIISPSLEDSSSHMKFEDNEKVLEKIGTR